MNLQTDDQLALRGRAMECMGHMAVAVEKEAFRPYFQETMKRCAESLQVDSTELHEYAFAVFANLSKVMGREFSPVLPELVPHVLKIIQESDGLISEEEAKENGELSDLAMPQGQGPQGGGQKQQQQLQAFDDSDAESDEEDEDKRYVVRTAMLDAKKCAITALGEMAGHCEADFLPYLETSMETLKNASEYWHPTIVEETLGVLPSLVVCSIAGHHANADGDGDGDGDGAKVPFENGEIGEASPMSAHTAAVCAAVMNVIVPFLDGNEASTVSAACSAIQSVLELCGPHALIPHATFVLPILLDLAKSKHKCQELEEGLSLEANTYQDEEDDEEDHDNYMTSTMDLIGAIARIMGQHFNQFLPQFLEPIANFCKTSRPTADRSMGQGAIAELAQGCKEGVLPFFETVFYPVIMSGLADKENSVRRNAAFAAGTICEEVSFFVFGVFLGCFWGVFGVLLGCFWGVFSCLAPSA